MKKSRIRNLALALLSIHASAFAQPVLSPKIDFIRERCRTAESVNNSSALYYKADGSKEPYTRVEWQVFNCHPALDKQMATVELGVSHKRSKFFRTAEEASKAPMDFNMNAHYFRIYFKESSPGNWDATAYQSASSPLFFYYSSVQDLQPKVLGASDLKAREGLSFETLMIPFGILAGIDPNMDCPGSKGKRIYCTPAER